MSIKKELFQVVGFGIGVLTTTVALNWFLIRLSFICSVIPDSNQIETFTTKWLQGRLMGLLSYIPVTIWSCFIDTRGESDFLMWQN